MGQHMLHLAQLPETPCYQGPFLASIDTMCFTSQIDQDTISRLIEYWENDKLCQEVISLETGIVRYGYGFQYDGIRFYFSGSEKLKPNVYIKCLSEMIQRKGAESTVSTIYCLMRKILRIDRKTKLHVSQIDMAFDFQSVLSKYLENDNYYVKTSLKTVRSYHKKETNKVTGEENQVLLWRLWGSAREVGYKVRIYDKKQEVEAKEEKKYWYGLWAEKGFDFSLPIWRVEFEVKRKFFNRWDVDSWEHFVNSRKAILGNLLEYFALTHNDDTNVSRRTPVKEWVYLLRYFHEPWTSFYVDTTKEQMKKRKYLALSKLHGALRRYLVNTVAHYCMENKVDSQKMDFRGFINNALAIFAKRIYEYIDFEDLFKEVQKAMLSKGIKFDVCPI